MAGAEPADDAAREETFRELVGEHSRMVFRLAYRITGNEADADDVVQETFLKAYRHFGRFDSRASFSTWIFRIAANCSIDVLRSRKRRPTAAASEEDFEVLSSRDASPERIALGAQIQASVAAALSELTPKERAAFVLRHFEGRSIEEIGKILDLRENAAKQAVFRAVRKLRFQLDAFQQAAR